jgi:hypothetical protein
VTAAVLTAMADDLLVISASNRQNLQLAEGFAASAGQRGLKAEVLDPTSLELPLFTPRR